MYVCCGTVRQSPQSSCSIMPLPDHAAAFLQPLNLFRCRAGKNNLEQIRITGQKYLPFQQDLTVFPAADLHRSGFFPQKYRIRRCHFNILRPFCRQYLRDPGYGSLNGQVHGFRTDPGIQAAQKNRNGLEGSLPFLTSIHIHKTVGGSGRFQPAPALKLLRHITAIEGESFRRGNLQPETGIGINPAFNLPGCFLQLSIGFRDVLLCFLRSRCCRGCCVRRTACLGCPAAAAGQDQQDQENPQQDLLFSLCSIFFFFLAPDFQYNLLLSSPGPRPEFVHVSATPGSSFVWIAQKYPSYRQGPFDYSR